MKTSDDRANTIATKATTLLIERCAVAVAFSRFFGALACAPCRGLATRRFMARMWSC